MAITILVESRTYLRISELPMSYKNSNLITSECWPEFGYCIFSWKELAFGVARKLISEKSLRIPSDSLCYTNSEDVKQCELLGNCD